MISRLTVERDLADGSLGAVPLALDLGRPLRAVWVAQRPPGELGDALMAEASRQCEARGLGPSSGT